MHLAYVSSSAPWVKSTLETCFQFHLKVIYNLVEVFQKFVRKLKS